MKSAVEKVEENKKGRKSMSTVNNKSKGEQSKMKTAVKNETKSTRGTKTTSGNNKKVNEEKGKNNTMKKAVNGTKNVKTVKSESNTKKAGRAGNLYTVVGREVSGTSVLKYDLESSSGTSKRVDKEQLYEMVLQNKITNCTTRVYNGDILFKGKGIDFKDLPKKDIGSGETSELKDALTVVAVSTEEAILKNGRGKEFTFSNEAYQELKNKGLIGQAKSKKASVAKAKTERKPRTQKEATTSVV